MFPLNWNIPFIKKNGVRSTLGKELAGSSYSLPTASAEVKGGVKIGFGLTMTGDVLSVSGGSGGNVYNHQLVFQHASNTARKISIMVASGSSTPITKEEAFALLYNDGTPITLNGVSVNATATYTYSISADMDGETPRFKFIDSSGANNSPVSGTTFSDTVFSI